MITGIKESNLLEQISCDCRYKLDGKGYNLDQKWN